MMHRDLKPKVFVTAAIRDKIFLFTLVGKHEFPGSACFHEDSLSNFWSLAFPTQSYAVTWDSRGEARVSS